MVLDEAQHPFYSRQRVLDLEYEGEQFIVLYEEAEGKVKMTLVWHSLVQLVTTFPAAKVKRDFGGE